MDRQTSSVCRILVTGLSNQILSAFGHKPSHFSFFPKKRLFYSTSLATPRRHGTNYPQCVLSTLLLFAFTLVYPIRYCPLLGKSPHGFAFSPKSPSYIAHHLPHLGDLRQTSHSVYPTNTYSNYTTMAHTTIQLQHQGP